MREAGARFIERLTEYDSTLGVMHNAALGKWVIFKRVTAFVPKRYGPKGAELQVGGGPKEYQVPVLSVDDSIPIDLAWDRVQERLDEMHLGKRLGFTPKTEMNKMIAEQVSSEYEWERQFDKDWEDYTQSEMGGAKMFHDIGAHA